MGQFVAGTTLPCRVMVTVLQGKMGNVLLDGCEVLAVCFLIFRNDDAIGRSPMHPTIRRRKVRLSDEQVFRMVLMSCSILLPREDDMRLLLAFRLGLAGHHSHHVPADLAAHGAASEPEGDDAHGSFRLGNRMEESSGRAR